MGGEVVMETIAKWCYRRFCILTSPSHIGYLPWEELPQLARDGWIAAIELAVLLHISKENFEKIHGTENPSEEWWMEQVGQFVTGVNSGEQRI